MKSKYQKKIKKLEKSLDELWSTFIRTRDFWSCMRCHQSFRHVTGINGLHAAHIIAKGRSKLLRWHPNNGLALCRGCHHWQHTSSTEIEFSRLCDRVRGKKAIDELVELKKDNPTVQFGLKDLEKKVSELEALLKTVQDH